MNVTMGNPGLTDTSCPVPRMARNSTRVSRKMVLRRKRRHNLMVLQKQWILISSSSQIRHQNRANPTIFALSHCAQIRACVAARAEELLWQFATCSGSSHCILANVACTIKPAGGFARVPHY